DLDEESLELHSLRAAARGVEVACIIDYDLPGVWRGDAGRIPQVLLNLIGNAVKFTEEGEILVTVSAEPGTQADGADLLRCEVRNAGIGISIEGQKHLLQPFTEADSSTTRRYGGPGLGLAISRQIVGCMGAELGVESERGKGSTFWFTTRLGRVS